jgi:hypothetical protein
MRWCQRWEDPVREEGRHLKSEINERWPYFCKEERCTPHLVQKIVQVLKVSVGGIAKGYSDDI